ncbi:hypothetical protein [Gloeobacter kilaueensis]|uniref:Uncharacterized protein n=1 Tax=Gloeobacter kilaueensis (strain ATCC BAA-2537 / CCAP 1431/1 / ULC 316 / JS1) TaxID=1183438 RepID=U5QC45_GLOK1|nr:hypothetical protein [Gloeobacter kilaueensis]AGY56477.1 hypothetical protein GKIL_0230 [Gloeobacter kilaueensis JS1]
MFTPETFSDNRPIHAPELLQTSFERLWLEATESLDQMIALKVVQLVRQTVEITYAIGYTDGRHTCLNLPQLT